MASVVAMNVFGTVNTMAPGPMPAAIRAKRRASVPLPTPTQCWVVQYAAKSRSNSSTMGPPMNPAVSRARLKTADSSSFSSAWRVTRSRKGILGIRINGRGGTGIEKGDSLGQASPPRVPSVGTQLLMRLVLLLYHDCIASNRYQYLEI